MVKQITETPAFSTNLSPNQRAGGKCLAQRTKKLRDVFPSDSDKQSYCTWFQTTTWFTKGEGVRKTTKEQHA
jgi:hypothetical protein